MIHRSKVLTGIARFINNDVALKLKGSIKYWIFTAAADIALANAQKVMESLANNEMLIRLGIVEGEMINVDALYTAIHKRAQESTALLDLKWLGSLTLDVNDVERMYQYIREA